MPLPVHLLLALGFAQGLFLCWQLWRLRDRNPGGYLHLLIALMAVLLVLLEQWLVQAGAWRSFPHLLRITVWMPFLFGPGLWLFVRSLDGPAPRRADVWHYLPALLALGWFLPFLTETAAAKRAFVMATAQIPLESTLFGLAKAASLFAYVIAIRWRLRHAAQDRLRRRFATATSAFLVFLGLLWLHFVAGHLWGELALPTDTLGALGLALFFYAASLIAVSYWRDFALSLAPAPLPSGPEQSQPAPAPTSDVPSDAPPDAPKTARLDSDTCARLYADLCVQVREQALYREPGLKLEGLAAQIGLPAHYLSFVINAGSGQNIQSWLNGFRVDAAKTALRDSDTAILDVGLAAGFNSKASFNRVFKEATGQSPSEFRARRSQIPN